MEIPIPVLLTDPCSPSLLLVVRLETTGIVASEPELCERALLLVRLETTGVDASELECCESARLEITGVVSLTRRSSESAEGIAVSDTRAQMRLKYDSSSRSLFSFLLCLCSLFASRQHSPSPPALSNSALISLKVTNFERRWFVSRDCISLVLVDFGILMRALCLYADFFLNEPDEPG